MIKASSVRNLIRRSGGKGTLRQKGVTYVATSGLPATVVYTLTSFVGVQQSDRSGFATDSPFRLAEEVIFISCTVAPFAGSHVDWGSKRWAVKHVEKIAPSGDTVLMYMLALAGA